MTVSLEDASLARPMSTGTMQRRLVLTLSVLDQALLALICTVAFCSTDAMAHQTKLSSSQLTMTGDTVAARIELNAIDLNVATGTSLTDADGNVDQQRLANQLATVQAYVDQHVALGDAGRAACDATWGSAKAKKDHVVLSESWRCPRGAALTYRVTLFQEIDPASRHMVSVDGDRTFIGLLSAQNPQMVLTQVAPSKWQTFGRYLVSGVEHIAIGYDHIAFLLAVIVLGRHFWPLFKVVTAFTVAHSITLTLAVLGVVTLPSQLVETLIAASIVYVALENFFVRDIRHRWWLTFTFGLIHGFGFASVLRDYGLPQDAVGLALAAFNIGVEIGQLVVVVMATLIWQGGIRTASAFGWQPNEKDERRVSLMISGVIFLFGMYWLLQRLFWS